MGWRALFPDFERQVRRDLPDVAAILDDPLAEWFRESQKRRASRWRWLISWARFWAAPAAVLLADLAWNAGVLVVAFAAFLVVLWVAKRIRKEPP